MKEEQGREAAARKLRFARRAASGFAKIDELPLDRIDAEWIEKFAAWMTSDLRLSANTCATYLRALHSVMVIAAKKGIGVDASVISKSFRANTAPLPKKVSVTATPVKTVDDTPQWYAMKCRTVDTSSMTRIIAEEYPSVDTFTTSVERLVAGPDGKHRREIELIRNIIFFRTTPDTCRRMKFSFHDRAYIYDYADSGTRRPAVIAPDDMKMFMYFNHIAPARILYYFPDESLRATIAAGTPVRITEGQFRGATGTIISPTAAEPLEATVAVDFPLLGITAAAPIPRAFLTVNKPRP